jgi:4-amino-4-deoxy-L-arabinose transferase-like glycosyltransferase
MKVAKWPRIAALLAVALVCFFRLGSTPLYETDEGFAATRADSFFLHHSWLLSYDAWEGDGPQFHKPPLLYWCVAVLFKTLGRNMWAVRLPTALAAAGCCWLFYLVNRRFFRESVALWSAVLPCTVPFLVLHIRTAMLDLPLLFLVMASAYALALRPPNLGNTLLAGLACGGALMLKGGAGLLALLVTAVFALLTAPSRRTIERLALCALVAATPVALYFAALPEAYQLPWWMGIFGQESAGRLVDRYSIAERWSYLWSPIVLNLRGHVPAAALGCLLLLRPRAPGQRLWAWWILALAVSVPTALIALKLPMSYPRYFLPIYFFLLTLSAAFASEAAGDRFRSWALVPFLAACWWIDNSPWRWAPIGAGALVFAVAQTPVLAARARAPLTASALMVGMIAGNLGSPEAWWHTQFPERPPRPELRVLAEKAAALTTPGETLLLGNDIRKPHTVLLYGRRSLRRFDEWLLAGPQAGARRYGIFLVDPPAHIPGVAITSLATQGNYRLSRIDVDDEAARMAGILLWGDRKPAELAETLRLLGAEHTAFPGGFVVQALPFSGEILTTQTNLVLRPGSDIDLALPGHRRVTGIDLHPLTGKEDMTGVRVEGKRADNLWIMLAEARDVCYPRLDGKGGRLADDQPAALRARWQPVAVSRLRITKWTGARFRVSEVIVRGSPLGKAVAPCENQGFP